MPGKKFAVIRFKGRLDTRAVESVRKKLEDLQKPITQKDAKDIANQCLSEMKDLISRGKSPIAGPGIDSNFPKYKNPKRYPGNKKPHSPVNLELTGKMLKDLKGRAVEAGSGYAAEVYYSDAKQKIKEKGHREGANDQPKRPTIPIANLGETFAKSISRVYLKIFSEAVSKIARRK